jgi:AcrR family transcriptional regulator
MYFPSKQDIALSRFSAAAESLTTALRERDPDETVTDVLRRWLRDEGLHDDADLKRLAGHMFAANPELNALRTARMAAAVDEGAAAVARQLGLPAGARGPRIAAVAAGGVLIEITDLPPGEARAQATTIAFAFLDAGIRTLGGVTRDLIENGEILALLGGNEGADQRTIDWPALTSSARRTRRSNRPAVSSALMWSATGGPGA